MKENEASTQGSLPQPYAEDPEQDGWVSIPSSFSQDFNFLVAD